MNQENSGKLTTYACKAALRKLALRKKLPLQLGGITGRCTALLGWSFLIVVKALGTVGMH